MVGGVRLKSPHPCHKYAKVYLEFVTYIRRIHDNF